MEVRLGSHRLIGALESEALEALNVVCIDYITGDYLPISKKLSEYNSSFLVFSRTVVCQVFKNIFTVGAIL